MNRLAGPVMLLFVALLSLGLGSCGGAGRPRCYRTTGKVLYKGQPAEWAKVTFVSLDNDDPKRPKPGGQVGSDGQFRLSTYASYDGAPAGRYAVLVVYPSPARKENDENAGPDLLEGRYADPKTTPLRVEIKKGTNEVGPFDLQ